MSTNIDSIIDFYLSLMPIAGAYALQIQGQVISHPPKGGMTNPFGAALTDADLSLQTFFEVATLAKFPTLSFFGEEAAQSFNMKYFPEGGELKVLVDPIDGTRYYADKLDAFNIIVSIVSKNGFEGAIVYVPGRNVCYYGSKPRGAFVCSTEELVSRQPGRPLQLTAESGTVITYDQPELARQVGGAFSVIDVLTEYRPGEGCAGINAILWGGAAAVLCRGHGLIDWGAISCIVECAGGSVTSWSGEPVPTADDLKTLHFDSVVMAADRNVNERIRSLIMT